jgi:hypothetical protein
MIQARVQEYPIIAGALTISFDLGQKNSGHVSSVPGKEYPESIVVYLDISAMDGAETLNFYGKGAGMDAYSDTVLTTEVDLNAAASTMVRVMLKAADVGPLESLKLVALGVDGSETVDVTVISW